MAAIKVHDVVLVPCRVLAVDQCHGDRSYLVAEPGTTREKPVARSRNSPLCKVGDVVSVDMETGEETPVEGGGLRMLPGPPGTCEWCHVKHDPAEPHNQQSLSYQMKFKAINGRYPTWTDAMEHCTPEVREQWRKGIIETYQARGLDVPPDLLDERNG